MTAYSQNGYSANDRREIATYTVNGTTVRLPLRIGDVAYVLLYVADRYNREVERLHDGWCWGYAARLIRGSSTTLSNHASGTAIDLNAPLHPLAADPAKSFSPKQIAAIHKIVADCGGVVRWGGDYSGRKDGMHFEINADARAVTALANKLRGVVVIRRNLKGGCKGADVKALQKRLAALGFNPGPIDGIYGPKTGAAVKKFKRSRHWPALNYTAGRLTIRALGGNLRWGK